MKILFQGDSITDCLRNKENNCATNVLGAGYVFLTSAYMLEKYPEQRFQFFNRGVSGNRIVDLLARWKSDCLNINPDFLFIYDGINDVLHDFASNNGVSSDLFESVYRMLLNQAFKNNPELRVVLIEPYFFFFGIVVSANPDKKAWNKRVDALRSIINTIARDYEGIVEVIHTQDIFEKALKLAPMEHWSLDGVHPSPAGHQLIANECESILCKFVGL